MTGVTGDECRGRVQCRRAAHRFMSAPRRSEVIDVGGDRRRYVDNERVPHHRNTRMSRLTEAGVQRGRV